MSPEVAVPQAAHPSAAVRHADQPRVNLSGSTRHDGEIDLIQDRLSPFLSLTSSWHGVIETLRAIEPSAHFQSLDLVDHSDTGNLLRLGDWLVGDDAAELERFCEAAKTTLGALGIRALRLVGCYTSCGPIACKVIETLRDNLGGPDVLACDSMLDEDAFDYRGCTSPNFSRGRPDKADLDETIAEDLNALLVHSAAPLPMESLREPSPIAPWRMPLEVTAAEADSVLAAVDTSRFWRLPGLLREPSSEIGFSTGADRGSIQLLFEGSLVRVFPHGEPARVYRPRAGAVATLRAASNDFKGRRARSAHPGSS